MKEMLEIKLPEGCFEGNCSDCVYADLYDRDSYGRVRCNNRNYGGYNRPQDRNGCFYYKG